MIFACLVNSVSLILGKCAILTFLAFLMILGTPLEDLFQMRVKWVVLTILHHSFLIFHKQTVWTFLVGSMPTVFLAWGLLVFLLFFVGIVFLFVLIHDFTLFFLLIGTWHAVDTLGRWGMVTSWSADETWWWGLFRFVIFITFTCFRLGIDHLGVGCCLFGLLTSLDSWRHYSILVPHMKHISILEAAFSDACSVAMGHLLPQLLIHEQSYLLRWNPNSTA